MWSDFQNGLPVITMLWLALGPTPLLLWAVSWSTDWRVWGLNRTVGARYSAPDQSNTGAHLYSWNKVSVRMVKRPGPAFTARVKFWDWSNMVSIASIPPSGWFRIRILIGTKEFFFLQNVQTGNLVHPGFCLRVPGFFPGNKAVRACG